MVSTSEGNFVSIQFMFSYINNSYILIVHDAGTCLSYIYDYIIIIIIRLCTSSMSFYIYYISMHRPMFFLSFGHM